MRRSFGLILSVLLVVLPLLGWHISGLAAQPAPGNLPTANWQQSSVRDWNTGTLDGLVVTNNDDGELRLDRDSARGAFTSSIWESAIPFSAVTVEWDVDQPANTSLAMEMRTSANGSEWRDWQVVPPSGLVIGGPRLLGPISTESDSKWLQYRVSFASTEQPAAPVVNAANWLVIGAGVGPTLADLPEPVPAYAPLETYNRPPNVIPAQAWGAVVIAPPEQVDRPRRLELSAIPAPVESDPPTFLRSLQQVALSYGADDLPYAYIVDDVGNVYAGRANPAVDGTLSIALLGELNDQSRAALADVLAWASQVYKVPLNLALAGDITPEQAEGVRRAADAKVVRSRSVFVYNNTLDYTERLMVFNPTPSEAQVAVNFLPGRANSLERVYAVAPGERLDLQLNEIFSDTAVLPLEVTSNRAVVVDRTMLFLKDALNEPAITDFSRTWYFAYGDGSAGKETTVWLYNPQSIQVAVNVSHIASNGITATTDVLLEPFSSTPVDVGQAVPRTFGIRVAATAPIAAERLMRFGAEKSGGFLSRGAVAPSRMWYFAEGATIAPYTTTLALFNPLPAASAITVTFLNEQGDSFIRRYQLPPVSRLDVEMRDIVPSPQGVGTVVESSLPIVAERVTYFNDGNAGTSTLGATQLAYSWYFAEGRTTDPATEFLLVANPNSQPAKITLEIGLTDGGTQMLEYDVPRMGRVAILLDNEIPFEERHTMRLNSNLPVVAERSIFIDGEDIKGGHTSLGIPSR